MLPMPDVEFDSIRHIKPEQYSFWGNTDTWPHTCIGTANLSLSALPSKESACISWIKGNHRCKIR